MATQTQSLSEKYKNILKKSATAYNPGAKPTASDVSAQQGLMKAQAAEESASAQALKEQWYGTETAAETGGNKKSWLQGALHTLGAPLYGIVGATEAVLGKGTEKGLANIPANVKEEGTFGDLLRSYGLSNAVAMPVGLALDIFADPINWGTAGTAALIPRVGVGAVKGGLEGAKLGLKSGLLMKAEKLGGIVPGLAKNAFAEGAEQTAGKIPTAYRNLVGEAVKSRGAYEAITDTGLTKTLENSVNKVRAFDKVENWLKERPWGQKYAIPLFKYSSSERFAAAGAEDAAMNMEGANALFPRTRGVAPTASVFDRLTGAKSAVDDIVDDSIVAAKNQSKLPFSSAKVSAELSEQATKDRLWKKAVADEIADIESGLFAGDEKALAKLGALTEQEKGKLVAAMQYYKSEVAGYDRTIAKALLSKAGRETLYAYALLIGAFKSAKIGGGLLSTGTNAIIGNAAMTSMFGVSILNPKLYKSIRNAASVVIGKDYRSLMKNPELMNYMKEYPTQFMSTYGIHPSIILSGGKYVDASFIDDVAKQMAKSGKQVNMNELDEVKQLLADASAKSAKEAPSTVSTYMNRMEPTSFMSTEVLRGPLGVMVQGLEEKAKAGNSLAALAHWYLTVPLEAYSKVDQGWKLGLTLHLVDNGVGVDELKKMAKRIAISPDDVTQVAGRNLYKFKPYKAAEIANEAYMDYLAMPGFVKIMRTMPLAGSPFFSFIYGMGSQTTKAAMYNPSVFNKINLALKEMTGTRSPLEKEALEQPYYQWYNRPGMVKLPFFGENPVYLNMENMLPYYTMNIFQPAERNYKSTVGNVAAKLMDKFPFFKTPEGQVLFDYVVQPLILQDEQAKGMFNQPLWSQDAGIAEKAGRGAQALIESQMPTMAGFAGLVGPKNPNVIPYLPSYRWRQLAFAKQGKSSVGIPTKEPAAEHTLRVLGAMAGWPTYSLKLQYNTPKK